MKTKTETYDVVVCGGGLAGLCAAVSAARLGKQTCIIQDRPVFGGNSSSEIRIASHGASAAHHYGRATGIISELLIEERAKNHEAIYEASTNSVWDMVMYDMVATTPNLTFYLDTLLHGVTKNEDDSKIESITAKIIPAETELTINGNVFIDCTGDGVLAELAGCEYRMGSEGKDEFGEYHAPEKATDDVMGNSIMFRAVDTGRPVEFKPPAWAADYNDASFFYEGGRDFYTLKGGYWWIEIGVPWHPVYDYEEIRHQLNRHVLGVWDWIKNKDPKLKEKAKNYAIDWLGQVLGKRESRRIMGHYLMTENDIQSNRKFEDEVAFGGWGVDLHTPGGLLAKCSEENAVTGYDPTSDYSVSITVGPYGIPLRSLIAKDIDNLMMAGRNVSVTHAALGTVRVQNTCALMGQAAGTAAYVALSKELLLKDLPDKAIKDIQQILLREGCFLPNVRNNDPLDLAKNATVSASSQAAFESASPHDCGDLGGLITGLEPNRSNEILKQRRGQLIAIGNDRLDKVAVYLSNDTLSDQQVEAVVVPVEHIWDYRCDTGTVLAKTVLTVPAKSDGWIDWNVNLNTSNGLSLGRYVRLDLMVNPNVRWHAAGIIEPGHIATFEIGNNRMKKFCDGLTMSVKVDPPQACYSPENVVSGVARPYQSTNLWRSNSKDGLPQWLELDFGKEEEIGLIKLVFPGNLLRALCHYPAFYRDPQCAKDYTISAYINNKWQELLHVENNYHTHCNHKLEEKIISQKLRITIQSTNGDMSAGVYEIRCYN